MAPNVQGREAAPDRPTLHERLVAKGVVVSHYRDCLYVPDSDRARLVIVEFVRDGREVSVSRFESRAGRTVWLEIPGHYGSFATSPSSRP